MNFMMRARRYVGVNRHVVTFFAYIQEEGLI